MVACAEETAPDEPAPPSGSSVLLGDVDAVEAMDAERVHA